eukprot:6612427-Alexandrium_andersonii.AAC.1
MSASLVGSEMCIRDRGSHNPCVALARPSLRPLPSPFVCLLREERDLLSVQSPSCTQSRGQKGDRVQGGR